jgi:hypothetical protein
MLPLSAAHLSNSPVRPAPFLLRFLPLDARANFSVANTATSWHRCERPNVHLLVWAVAEADLARRIAHENLPKLMI